MSLVLTFYGFYEYAAESRPQGAFGINPNKKFSNESAALLRFFYRQYPAFNPTDLAVRNGLVLECVSTRVAPLRTGSPSVVTTT